MYNHKNGCRLRKVGRQDLPKLLDLKGESWWGTHKTVIANSDDQEKWFDSIPASSLFMMADVIDNHGYWNALGVAVYTNIDHHNRSLSISGSIFKCHRIEEHCKTGFAAGLDFAFEMLNVERVDAEVLAYNVPAQKLEIDYLGFKVEGRKRRAVIKCGRYYDSLVLGMLREEWATSPRVVALGDTCNTNFSHDKMNRIQDRFSREVGVAATAESLVGGSSPLPQS